MHIEQKRMVSGLLYNSLDAELVKRRQNAQRLCRLYNQTTEQNTVYRRQLLTELLGTTGRAVYIEPTFRCDYGFNIHVGENFYANYDCVMLDAAEIRIGNNVMLAPRVGLYTAAHPIDAGVRNTYLEFAKPITIGDNVWIGANSSIVPGGCVGNNTVIGAGSVVTKNIPDNVVAAGVPCRVIKEITPEDARFWQAQQDDYYSAL